MIQLVCRSRASRLAAGCTCRSSRPGAVVGSTLRSRSELPTRAPSTCSTCYLHGAIFSNRARLGVAHSSPMRTRAARSGGLRAAGRRARIQRRAAEDLRRHPRCRAGPSRAPLRGPSSSRPTGGQEHRMKIVGSCCRTGTPPSSARPPALSDARAGRLPSEPFRSTIARAC